jgi:hypothetical protein
MCAIAAGVPVVTVRLVLEPLGFEYPPLRPASGFGDICPRPFFARLSKPASPVACSAILPATPDLTKSPRRFPPPRTVKETSRPCVGDAYPGNRPRVRKSEVKVHVVGSSLWVMNSSTNSFAATSKPSKASLAAVTQFCWRYGSGGPQRYTRGRSRSIPGRQRRAYQLFQAVGYGIRGIRGLLVRPGARPGLISSGVRGADG